MLKPPIDGSIIQRVVNNHRGYLCDRWIGTIVRAKFGVGTMAPNIRQDFIAECVDRCTDTVF